MDVKVRGAIISRVAMPPMPGGRSFPAISWLIVLKQGAIDTLVRRQTRKYYCIQGPWMGGRNSFVNPESGANSNPMQSFTGAVLLFGGTPHLVRFR